MFSRFYISFSGGFGYVKSQDHGEIGSCKAVFPWRSDRLACQWARKCRYRRQSPDRGRPKAPNMAAARPRFTRREAFSRSAEPYGNGPTASPPRSSPKRNTSAPAVRSFPIFLRLYISAHTPYSPLNIALVFFVYPQNARAISYGYPQINAFFEILNCSF